MSIGFSALALAAPVQAQLIGVQFSKDSPVNLSPTAVAGVISQDHFNVLTIIDPAFSASNLLTSTGANSGVNFGVTNDSDVNITGTNSGALAGTPNALLLASQAGDWQGGSPVYTFSGLAPGDEYDLVVYMEGNGSLVDEFSLTEGTTSSPSSYFAEFQSASDFNGTFIQSTATTAGAATTEANYVEFLDVSPNAAGDIQFQTPTGVNVDNWAPVSAIQLEEVPEPPVLGLGTATALALFFGYLRKRHNSICRA